jgi:hypothetical protein
MVTCARKKAPADSDDDDAENKSRRSKTPSSANGSSSSKHAALLKRIKQGLSAVGCGEKREEKKMKWTLILL